MYKRQSTVAASADRSVLSRLFLPRIPDCLLPADRLPRPRAQQPSERDRLHTGRECSSEGGRRQTGGVSERPSHILRCCCHGDGTGPQPRSSGALAAAVLRTLAPGLLVSGLKTARSDLAVRSAIVTACLPRPAHWLRRHSLTLIQPRRPSC